MAPPSKFAHVVYKTHRFDEMVDWYMRVLECRVQHKNDAAAFLTYDDEHHRIALVNLGPAPADEAQSGRAKPSLYRKTAGVDHVAYTWSTLGDLMNVYKRLKAEGIVPLIKMRHGPTLSMYYADPDGNCMEFQVDLMAAEEANDFLHGPAFAANPIGEPFDPDALVAAMEAGAPVAPLVMRSDQRR